MVTRRKNRLLTDALREIRNTKNRFLSLFILAALAVAFLAGLRTTSPNMKYTADQYFDHLNLMDGRVLSTLGLTDDDLNALSAQDGIAHVEGAWNVDVVCEDKILTVQSVPQTINQVNLTSGRMPEQDDECIAELNFLSAEGLSLGDTVTLDLAASDAEDILSRSTFTIVGTADSPMYISVDRGSSSLGTGRISAFLLVPPENFQKLDYYTAAYFTVDGLSSLDCYGDEYEDRMDNLIDTLESFSKERAGLRYQEIVGEAQQELDDAWAEYYDAKSEADQELGDAETELNDARRELDDGWSEYHDGHATLLRETDDARRELDDGERELADGYQELLDGETKYTDGLAEYADGKQQYEDGLAEYYDGLAQYEDGLAEFEDGQAEYREAETTYQDGLAEYQDGLAEYQDGLAAYQEGLADYEDGLKQYQDGMAEYEDAYAAFQEGKADYEQGLLDWQDGKAQYEEGLAEYEDGQKSYQEGLADYEEGRQTYEDALAEYEKGYQEWLDGKAKYEEGLAQYEDGLAEYEAGLKEFESGKKEYEKGLADYQAGREELNEGWSKYYDGLDQYESGKASLEAAEIQLGDARVQLDNARPQLDAGWAQLGISYDSAPETLAQMQAALSETQELLSQAQTGLEQAQGAHEQAQAALEALKAAGVPEDDPQYLRAVAAEAQTAGLVQAAQDGVAQAEGGIAQLNAGIEGIQSLMVGEGQYRSGMASYESGWATLERSREELNSAKRQLDEALPPLEEGEKELAGAKAQLDEAQAEVESGEKELADAKRELDRAKRELDDAKQELDDGEVELEEGRQELDEAKQELDDAERQLADAKTELDDAWTQLEEARLELEDGERELQEAKQELDDGEQELADGKAELDDAKIELDDAKVELDDAKTELEDAEQKLADAKAELEDGKQQLADAKAELDDAEAELTDAKTELDDGWAELEEARLELEDADLELLDARRELDDGWNDYEEGTVELEDGRRELETETAKALRELDDAYQTLTDGETEYADGLVEYQDGKSDADRELADARKKLADAQKEIDDIEECEWYVLGRNTLAGYVTYGSDSERMSSLADVFPVIFFLVAALACLTTMTRMVEEQRTQIGGMKALGFTRGAISIKYIGYAFLASFLGGLVGAVLGCIVIPLVIYHAWGIMYTLPSMEFLLQPQVCGLAILAAAACTTGASLAACFSTLTDTPANLMRPKAPKVGKKVLLEHIPVLWKRLSFSQKVTIRNLFRYKRRFWMTVIGIGGCTALIVTGFGIHNSIFDILDKQYDEISPYNASAGLRDNITQEQLNIITNWLDEAPEIESYLTSYEELVEVDSDSGVYDGVYLFAVDNLESFQKYINLRHRTDSEPVTLPEDGIIITEKLSELLDVSIGDKITIVGDRRIDVPVGDIVENYVYHYIYLTEDCYENLFGEHPVHNTLMLSYTDDSNEVSDAVSTELMKLEGVASYSHVAYIRDTFTDSMASIDYAVVIIILAAAALAFVVLYNLTNINITERRRELATLKVLGFYDSEVSAYVYRENIFLTIFGIILGLFMGKWLHSWLILTVEVNMVMFGRTAAPISYVWAALLTIVFSIAVNIVAHFSLKKIDMVESLKTVE